MKCTPVYSHMPAVDIMLNKLEQAAVGQMITGQTLTTKVL